jgi:hypothetical protein
VSPHKEKKGMLNFVYSKPRVTTQIEKGEVKLHISLTSFNHTKIKVEVKLYILLTSCHHTKKEKEVKRYKFLNSCHHTKRKRGF